MRTKTVIIIGIIIIAGIVGTLFLIGRPYPSYDWGDFDVLKQGAPGPEIPKYHGQEIPYDEYKNWIAWGEEWFRHETFGNKRFATDITGFLNAPVDVPDGQGGYRTEKFFKFLIEAIDALDSTRGNLYTGNGGGYTHDLAVSFPEGSKLHKDFPLPAKLHLGLDVEAGSAWPIGVVPIAAPEKDSALAYLHDPGLYANGPAGVGADSSGKKYRAGFSCALCHYSLDVDWDGKTDLKSARLGVETPGSQYKPQDAWAVGNQDLHIGWVFALAENPVAALFASGRAGKLSLEEARKWVKEILDKYQSQPAEMTSEVVRGVLLMPRGYFDDTPDAIPNAVQYPAIFTRRNWPFNYDGVMMNASDRNNNVWSISLDPSQLVGLCKDRLGKTNKLLFWKEPDIFRQMTAAEYADLVVRFSPAAKHDPSTKAGLIADVLGTADGMPGVTDNAAMVLIEEARLAVPKEVLHHENNVKYNRVRPSKEFGVDGKYRGQMAGLLGTKVITSAKIKQQYHIDELEKKYGLNGDEFISDAVSLMLDWVEPPTNHSSLLANARHAGLVEKGYEVFKEQGCAACHAGPFFTDNKIIPLKKIGTNHARAKATEPLQTFIAPEYDPATGKAISKGVVAFVRKLTGLKQKYGYKVVTLRYLWGTAPYLHDGGVGIALQPDSAAASDDLKLLLSRTDQDKLIGMGQILAYREANPESYTRPNAALSLQALLLKSERDKVIAANQEKVYPIPGSSEHTSMAGLNIEGIGHEYWIQDEPGGDTITALVAFLLALDDEPGK